MEYDISFGLPDSSTDPDAVWFCYPVQSGSMIKEVCGHYPSEWAGTRCADLQPVLERAVQMLTESPQTYRIFEDPAARITVENTTDFLDRLCTCCRVRPTYTLNVGIT